MQAQNLPQAQALPGPGATMPTRATAPESQAPPQPQTPTAPRGPPPRIIYLEGFQQDQVPSESQIQQALAEQQTSPTPPTLPTPPTRMRGPPPQALPIEEESRPRSKRRREQAPAEPSTAQYPAPLTPAQGPPATFLSQVPTSPSAPPHPAVAFEQAPPPPLPLSSRPLFTPRSCPPGFDPAQFEQARAEASTAQYPAPLTPAQGLPAPFFPQVPTYPSALPHLAVAFEQAPPPPLPLSSRPLFTPRSCPPGFDPAQFELQEALKELLAFSRDDRLTWLHLAGLYLQHVWEPTLFPVAQRLWQRDVKKDDLLEKFPGAAAIWPAPEAGTPLEAMVGALGNSDFGRAVLQIAISQWSLAAPIREVEEVMNLASWKIPDLDPDVFTIGKIKNMAEGPEKQALLAQVEARSPRFFRKCMEDPLCGIKRKPEQASNYAPEPKRRWSQEWGPTNTYRQVYGPAEGQSSPNFKQQFLAEQRQKKVLQEEKRQARLALLQATREEQPARAAYDPKAWVKGANFTHFPDVKRTKLAPVECMAPPKKHTAFDTFFGDLGVIPRDENMEPDPSRMNCWWRALYTVDQTIGSNLCWLKD